MKARQVLSTLLLVIASTLTGCSVNELSPAGSSVAVVRNQLPPGCETLSYLVGKGGGAFGGDLISNESLIEYAMNDLRNQAAKLGATHVQADPPQLGAHQGTTTSVTITGTAYRCESDSPRPAKPPAKSEDS